MKKHLRLALFGLTLSCLCLKGNTAYAVVLPDPTDIFDGIQVATEYDDFYVYSARLLDDEWELIDLGSAGVGQFDITILTQAGGIDNVNIGKNSNYTFEDPAESEAGADSDVFDYTATWGAGDATINGPVLVDDVVNYLREQFNDPQASIPVFTFDLVEPGAPAKRDIDMAANFIVFDPVNQQVVDGWSSWSLDNTDNGQFDNPIAHITFPGKIEVTGTSGTKYTAQNATGSGAFDFLIYSPDMNLANYMGHGYEFHIFTSVGDAHGGGEEITISGSIRAPGGDDPGPVIPEPGTMMLLGIGIAGAALRKRIA